VSGVSGGFSGAAKNSLLSGCPADIVSSKMGWDAQEGRWVFDPGRALPREDPDGRRFADVDYIVVTEDGDDGPGVEV
jgi:hypothetical protein